LVGEAAEDTSYKGAMLLLLQKSNVPAIVAANCGGRPRRSIFDRSVDRSVLRDQHINHQSPDAEGRRLPKSHDCPIKATLDCILIVMALLSCSCGRPFDRPPTTAAI
jgi:hypothetical protein